MSTPGPTATAAEPPPARDGQPATTTAAPTTAGARRALPMLPLPLALLMLALTYWCVDMVTPAVPVIQRELTLSGAGAGLVVSVFFLGRLLTNFPAAVLIERIGPRGCAMLGAGLLLAGSGIVATAGGETALLLGRGTQGAGVALLATAGLLSVLRAWSGGGAAMTAFNVAAGVGGSVGLFLGGVITARLGWREVFWLSAELGLTMLVSTVIVHTVQGRRRQTRTFAATPAEVGLATNGRGLGAGLLANLLVYGNYSIWVVSLGLLAADRFGSSASDLGTLLLVVNTIHLLAAFPAGTVIRRTGVAPALVAGFAVCAVGMALTVAAPTFVWLYPGMTLYAIGQIVANSAAGDLVLRAGGAGGRAVGLLRLTSDIGLVAGPVLAGLLADRAGTAAPFVVLAGLTAAGAAVALAPGRGRRRAMARS